MNVTLWLLQALTALMYAASGYIKIFMFDKISKDVRSFAACLVKFGFVSGSWSYSASPV